MRRDILEADAGALANTLRTQLLRPLVGFNFGWEHQTPYFNFNIEEEEDLKAVAETYKILLEAGYPLTLEHVSDRFGVPLPEAGQEVIGQGSGVRGRGTLPCCPCEMAGNWKLLSVTGRSYGHSRRWQSLLRKLCKRLSPLRW